MNRAISRGSNDQANRHDLRRRRQVFRMMNKPDPEAEGIDWSFMYMKVKHTHAIILCRHLKLAREDLVTSIYPRKL